MHRSASLTVTKSMTMAAECSESYLIKEKYNRLLESHHKLLRVNQNLEDKLLKVVTICEEQKNTMKTELEDAKERLKIAEARVQHLEEENVKYRQDCLLAVQLLQCNPAGFVDQEFRSLPSYVQSRLEPSFHQSSNGGSGNYSSRRDSFEDETYPQNGTVTEYNIFSLPFPPSAVMVPTTRREKQPDNTASCNQQYSSVTNGHEDRQFAELASKRVSAGSIAKVITEDLLALKSNGCDVRARSSVQTIKEENSGAGRVLHL